MTTLLMSVVIESSTVVTLISSAVIAVIAWFMVRAFSQYDEKLKDHNIRLMDHELKISDHAAELRELKASTVALKETVDTAYHNLAQQLIHITNKLDAYDKNIRDFYEKYDLKLKGGK